MCAARPSWHLELTDTADEVLVLFAAAGFSEARSALIERYHPLCSRWLSLDKPRLHLSATDRDDLQQDLVFWIDEAVRRFDMEQLSKPNGCGFRTFLRQVFRRRLADRARASRRLLRRFGNSSNDCLESQLAAASEKSHGDAAATLSRDEMLERVAKAVARLDGSARLSCAGFLAGKKLRLIAKELGVCYETAKRHCAGCSPSSGASLSGPVLTEPMTRIEVT
jgi:RNA polymerase sigma factor (sigma-70 family)